MISTFSCVSHTCENFPRRGPEIDIRGNCRCRGKQAWFAELIVTKHMPWKERGFWCKILRFSLSPATGNGVLKVRTNCNYVERRICSLLALSFLQMSADYWRCLIRRFAGNVKYWERVIFDARFRDFLVTFSTSRKRNTIAVLQESNFWKALASIHVQELW